MALKTNSPSVIALAALLEITRTRALALLRRSGEDESLAVETHYRETNQSTNHLTNQTTNQVNSQSIDQVNNQSVDQVNNQSIDQVNNQSTDQVSNNQSSSQSNDPSNDQSHDQPNSQSTNQISSQSVSQTDNQSTNQIESLAVETYYRDPNQIHDQPNDQIHSQSNNQLDESSSDQSISQSNGESTNQVTEPMANAIPTAVAFAEPVSQPVQHSYSSPLHMQSSNLNPIVSQSSSAALDLDRFIRGEDSYLTSSSSSVTDAAKLFEAKRLARMAAATHTVKQEKPQVSTGLFSSERSSSSLFSPQNSSSSNSNNTGLFSSERSPSSSSLFSPHGSSSSNGSTSIKSESRSALSSSSSNVKSEPIGSSNSFSSSSSSSSSSSHKPRDGKLTVTISDDSPNAPHPSMIVRLIPHVNFHKVYRMFESKNYVEPRLSFLGVEIQRNDVPQDLDIFDGAQLELHYSSIRQLPPNQPVQSQSLSSSSSSAAACSNASRVKRERDEDEWGASCSDKRVKIDDNDDDGSNSGLPSPSSSVLIPIPTIPSYSDTIPWFKTLLLGTFDVSFRSMGLDKLEKKQLEWSKFQSFVYSGLLMVQSESTRNWQAITSCVEAKPSYFDLKIRLVKTEKVEGQAMPNSDGEDMSDDYDSDDMDDDMGMFGGYSRYRRRSRPRARMSAMLDSLISSSLMGGIGIGLTGLHHFVHHLKVDVSITAQAMESPIRGLNELLHLTIGNKFDRLRKAAFGSMHNKHSTPSMDITSILALAQRKSFTAKLPPVTSASSAVLARIKREKAEEKGDAVAETTEDQPFEQRALSYLRAECERADNEWPNEWLTSSDGILDPADFSDMCQSRLILRDYQLQSVLWMLGQELSPSIASPFWQTMIIDGQQLLYSPLLQAFRTGPLEDTRGGLLCDSMGLGKTISIMALANVHPAPAAWLANDPKSNETKTRSRATIVIAPSSLVGQWVAELNKASMKSPKILCYYGSTRPTNAWLVADHDYVLTTPDVLANDMEGRRGTTGPLFAVEWWRVIVDEGHTLKDMNTKRSHACRALKSQQRFLLTGTPMSSALSNLHGLFAFLHIKAIGDWNPLWTNMDAVANGTRQRRNNTIHYEGPNLYRLLELMMTQLCMRHSKDSPFNGRRDLIELPPIHMTNIKINFSAEQKAAYAELDEFARKKFDALVAADQLRAKTIVALSYLLPARQACAGGIINMAEQRRKEQLAQAQLDAVQAARVRADVRSFSAAYDDSDDDGDDPNNDPSNVRSYPVAKQPAFNELTDECTICLSEFSLPLQTSCNHLYCADCVLQLISHSPGAAMCPQCRAHLTSKKLFQPLKPRAPTPPPVVVDAPAAPAVKEEQKEEKKDETQTVIFDAKLRVLLDHLLIDQQQSPAVKCLVFTQFTSTLQWIESALNARGIKTFKITGDMAMTRRTRILQQFNQSNEFTVFLLSIRAGAVGLTLTAASRVYLCEPCLNPSLTLQAIGRVCRLGQRNEVQIKQLVMRDSVEERIEAIVKDRLKDLHSHFSSAAQRSDDSEPQLAANIGAINRDGTASIQTQQLYTLFGRAL